MGFIPSLVLISPTDVAVAVGWTVSVGLGSIVFVRSTGGLEKVAVAMEDSVGTGEKNCGAAHEPTQVKITIIPMKAPILRKVFTLGMDSLNDVKGFEKLSFFNAVV